MRVSSVFAIGCGVLVAAALAACSSGTRDDTTPDAGTTANKPDAGTTPDAGTVVTKNAPGTACTADDECLGPAGQCISSLPNGYCTKDCVLANQCPGNTKCQAFGDSSKCVAGCETDADCRKNEGYFCDPDGKFCISVKYTPTTPGGAQIGEPCARVEDCEGDSCIVEVSTSTTACTPENAATTCNSGQCGANKKCVGSPTGYTGGYCLAYCTDGHPESCPQGATCLNGSCRKSCTQNGDCRGAPYACVDGTCRLDPTGIALGGACINSGACSKGASCITEDESASTFPGGACSLIDDCNPETGTGCGGDGKCLALLSSQSDGSIAPLPSCLKVCQADADCRTGYKCDATSHVCLRPAATDFTKVKLGAACAVDTDCDSVVGVGGTCLKSDVFPKGYCVAGGCTRTTDADDTCKAAGGHCYVLAGLTNQRQCIKSCTAAADCRAADGYACDLSDNTCWIAPPK